MSPLTTEEAAELRRLRIAIAEEEDRQRGLAAIQAAGRQRRLATERRPFSIYRSTVGALRDAAQGLIDTATDFNAGLNPVQAAAIRKSQKEYFQLPKLKGEDQAGTAERVVRGIGSFLIPYTAAAKIVGVARSASWLGRAGKAALAGSAVDFAQVDPVSGNLANVMRDTFGIKSDTLDALASEEDDEALYARFKAAATNAPVGIAADALFEVGFRGVKAYRAWKGTAEEAEETLRSIREDIILDPAARNFEDAAEASAEATVPGARPTSKAAGEAYDPIKHVRVKAPPKDFDDVLTYLREKAGEVDEDGVSKLAGDFLATDPENALAQVGIDPAKLDYSAFEDPEALGRLHAGLAEVYESIASKLGRSNIRVTEAATLRTARLLATSADALKRVHGSTENLAEYLTASRLIVGAHAHKLLSLADEAMAEIAEGGAGAKWTEFAAAFYRHAFYMGTIRGAGSEVGRALRSLQTVGKVYDPRKAAAHLETALKAEGGELPGAIRQDAETYLGSLVTDADKVAALARLKSLSGDVGELSRHVRQKNNGVLRRVDLGLRETIGNLFSVGTATLNLASGGLMLGSRVLAKGLAGIGRMALSPLGARHSMAARVHFMETWAFADGILGAYREAFDKTLKLFESEGLAEVALNLDSMGLNGLAKKAALRSAEAGDALRVGNFERTEVKNTRSLSISTDEQLRLRKLIEGENGPTFFSNALMGLVKSVSAGINVVGSLSRAGTIAFINLPDQFVGTLAARAGAQAHALRLAADEAAELGLEGKELIAYLKARTVQLSSDVDGWHPDGFDAGAREAMSRHGDAEAREVLFQDDLEFFGPVTRLGDIPLVHMILPFIKTPLRILERTAIDNTPLGAVKKAHRDAIFAGGPAADEARARLALGLLAIGTAFQLADDRIVVGHDGGFASSARVAGRPAFSLKVGDDVVEFNRLDPFGMLLGFGADMRSYLDHAEGDPEASEGARLAAEGMLWGFSSNILSKTWLTSLRNLVDVASATDDERALGKLGKMAQTFAVRFVPASGFQRQIEKADDGFLRDADGFIDNMVKASIGANTLPVKRDSLLGRPVAAEGLDRLIGMRVAPGVDAEGDPLLAELEKLSFDFPAAKRTQDGIKLNATQFSRWLELRGQIVRNETTGLTLEETLRAVVTHPDYQTLNRAARVDVIRKEMRGFARLATDALRLEDKTLDYRMIRKEIHSTLELQGASPQQKVEETRRVAELLGIPVAE